MRCDIYYNISYAFADRYRITLNITSESYTHRLGDRNSREFAELQRRLSDAVFAVVENLPAHSVVSIISTRWES